MKESKDILTLFEVLSNHEVFTPPRVANAMLDLLPESVWEDPSIRLLDPATKSGVFLREAFFRFFEHLPSKKHRAHDGRVYNLADRQQRINHILKNMLYGIAISELTSYVARRTLYGVMRANTDKQVASLDGFMKSSDFKRWSDQDKDAFIGRNRFNEYYDHRLFCVPEYRNFESEGNIFYPVNEVQKKVIEEDSYEVEDTYYPFIVEGTKHKKILDIRSGKMRFDVIVGNPPYQVRDEGKTTGASPIYHKFIDSAKKLSPKYLVMVIPSRWFAGGKGLMSFRKEMLEDKAISHLVDFTDARECFPGVDIAGGVCYFLRNSKHKGLCEVTSHHSGAKDIMVRDLDEFQTFVRYNKAVEVLRRVQSKKIPSFSDQVSSRKPFGLATNVRPMQNGDIRLVHNAGEGFYKRALIDVGSDMIDLWKVATSKVSYDHAGQPDKDGKRKVLSKVFLLPPKSICTETYIIAGKFKTKSEAENCASFLKTKFVRFLVSLMSFSQDITKDRFRYVPQVVFSERWTDEKLYKFFELEPEHIECINSLIKDFD